MLFAYGIRKKPRWYTVFSNQSICLWRLLRKIAAPHAQSLDVPMPMSLSRRTRRLLAPTGLVHAAMPSLTANARQQATWLWQSMQNHQMDLQWTMQFVLQCYFFEFRYLFWLLYKCAQLRAKRAKWTKWGMISVSDLIRCALCVTRGSNSPSPPPMNGLRFADPPPQPSGN